MFSKILEIFRKHSALDEVEKKLDEMLEIASDIFNKATEALETGTIGADYGEYIWKRDRKINGIEQEIRRRLYTHLVISGTADLYPAMAFLRVVQDAERCGDYVKNLFSVIEAMTEPETGETAEKLLRLRRHTIKQFQNIREVLKNNDEKLAQKIVEFSRRDQDECEQNILNMIRKEDEDIRCNNPVAAALSFRYYKRLLSHLIHIAQAMYMPLDTRIS